jgi:hypothetical protein
MRIVSTEGLFLIQPCVVASQYSIFDSLPPDMVSIVSYVAWSMRSQSSLSSGANVNCRFILQVGSLALLSLTKFWGLFSVNSPKVAQTTTDLRLAKFVSGGYTQTKHYVVLRALKLLVCRCRRIIRAFPCSIFGVGFWMGAVERSYLHMILSLGLWVPSSKICCRYLEELGWFPPLDL